MLPNKCSTSPLLQFSANKGSPSNLCARAKDAFSNLWSKNSSAPRLKFPHATRLHLAALLGAPWIADAVPALLFLPPGSCHPSYVGKQDDALLLAAPVHFSISPVSACSPCAPSSLSRQRCDSHCGRNASIQNALGNRHHSVAVLVDGRHHLKSPVAETSQSKHSCHDTLTWFASACKCVRACASARAHGDVRGGCEACVWGCVWG